LSIGKTLKKEKGKKIKEEILRANALRMTTLVGILTGFSRNPQNDKLEETVGNYYWRP
jgi:hypothetical protein